MDILAETIFILHTVFVLVLFQDWVLLEALSEMEVSVQEDCPWDQHL